MFSCILNVSPPPPAALTPISTYGHHYSSLPQPAFPPSNSSYITPPIYPPPSFFAPTRLSLSQTPDEGHWELNMDPVTFRELEDMVKKYLVHQQLYPSHILPSSSQTTPPPTTNLFLPPPATLAPTPTYGHCYPSLPKPDSPPPNSSYITPPTLSSSAASPPTPPGMEDCAACIVSASSSPGIPKSPPPSSSYGVDHLETTT
ncbi:uncharacterized protein F5891DRAFT_1198586 [Suillus fuscotomentosus]|uniref:Uncharacterized protein n=1 Tax=Suillus fuscotomentosus TaxID=1912939 RepID=A0AAD4DQ47_9AGAM|nr:uncharacterized protein F5891DRAFT_1198586 [Suillus fuscotomentosus]KAG1889606.1 hypothetical protein F5891DRAFT_1198586 [Suillus fuscotomentosus]